MRYTTLLLLLLLITHHAFTQRRKFVHPPKYILVQLKSERNRIAHFEKQNKADKLAQIKEDCELINKLMIDDFEKNFTYCNVYYFYDTNAHLIKAKNFRGILLDKDREAIKNIVLSAADSNYYMIGCFGYSLPTRAQPNAGKIGQGLVVLNHRYESMESPFPNHIYKTPALNKAINASKGQTTYRSKHFDLEYYPVAKHFSDKLEYFFRPRANDFNFPQ